MELYLLKILSLIKEWSTQATHRYVLFNKTKLKINLINNNNSTNNKNNNNKHNNKGQKIKRSNLQKNFSLMRTSNKDNNEKINGN